MEQLACTFNEAQILANKILDHHKKGINIIGFDTETTVNRKSDPGKVSTIQISYDFNGKKQGYIFQIFRINEPFSPLLKKILQSNKLIKVGIDIIGDMNKLYDSYKIRSSGYIDAQSLAITLGIPAKSMNDLGLKFVPGYSLKDPFDHRGDWDGELSTEQKCYGIRDAYISYLIYIRMLNIKIENVEDYQTDDLDCLCNWIKIQLEKSVKNRSINSVMNQIINSYKPWANKYMETEKREKAMELIMQMEKKNMISIDLKRSEFVVREGDDIILSQKFRDKIKGLKYDSAINYIVNSYGPISCLSTLEKRQWAKKQLENP